MGSGMVGPYLLVGHVSVLAGAPRSTVGRCPVVFGRVCLAAAPCDSKAAVASALVPRRALNSSAFGPRVRVSMCQLEGLVAAGMEVEGGAGNSQEGAGLQG